MQFQQQRIYLIWWIHYMCIGLSQDNDCQTYWSTVFADWLKWWWSNIISRTVEDLLREDVGWEEPAEDWGNVQIDGWEWRWSDHEAGIHKCDTLYDRQS